MTLVGSRVRFRFGLGSEIGTVVEDLGKIGAGGRRLVRVAVPGRWTFDVPAEELKVLRSARVRR